MVLPCLGIIENSVYNAQTCLDSEIRAYTLFTDKCFVLLWCVQEVLGLMYQVLSGRYACGIAKTRHCTSY